MNRRVVELSSRFQILCGDAGMPFVDLVNDHVWTTDVHAGEGAHPGAVGYERLAASAVPA